MKKFTSILLIVLVIISLTGCGKQGNELNDALKFKEEYESLNGTTSSSGKEYRNISISEDNPFVYSNAQEIVNKIENDETFYVYFGSLYCPWCRSVIEKAIEIANENNIEIIYYVDIWDKDHNEILRDTYKINDEGKVELASNGTEEYQKLLKYFDSLLEDYMLTDQNGKSISVGEKRIYAPNFIYVIDGNAIKLESGMSELQKDSREELTKEILEDETNKFNEFFQN